MDKIKYIWMAFTLIALMGAASAQVLEDRYQRPCGDVDLVDLCQWDNVMPLGSENCCGCGLDYNTFWPLGSDAAPSDATVTCTFDGSAYNVHDLFISIDNDVISCTLNGNEVLGYTPHEGCAPEDPRDGYDISLSPTTGMNTLVCQVRDRGSMSHFDACVVGSEPAENLPEYPTPVLPAVLMITIPALAFVVVKKLE